MSKSAVKLGGKKRILLFIHGTFSHSNKFHSELVSTEDGREFLREARQSYEQVVFFDHPTLQVSPVMNAVDLERLLRSSPATFDVIGYSRGGLVARWWAEALARDPGQVGRVIHVGSPLAGTSLAAPPKLKRVLEYLTNVFEVLRKGSILAEQAFPIMIVVTGLLRVIASTAKFVGRTPLSTPRSPWCLV